MSDLRLQAIPEHRRAAALDALTALGAFGEARPVTGGASGAHIFRVESAGRDMLLRLETRTPPPFRDQPRAYACMAAAEAAGIAPRVHFVDAAEGVAVMDFIEARPLADFPGGPEALVEALGRLAGEVQAIEPVFPEPRIDYPSSVAMLFAGLANAGLFAPAALERHLEGLAEIRAALPWGASMGSSHNDINAQNVLFDGARLWLIDWELAYRNDPLVDVAILANAFAPTPTLRDRLVAAATGRTPDRLTLARLALIRQIATAFYASALLLPFARIPREAPESVDALTPSEFEREYLAGRLPPGSPALMLAYGKMHLAGFLAPFSDPAFAEAIETAKAG